MADRSEAIAPGEPIGLVQVNFRIPGDTPPGAATVAVRASEFSNTALSQWP